MASTEALQPKGDGVLYAIDASISLLAEVLQAVSSSIIRVQQNGDRRFKTGVFLYNNARPPVKEIMPLENAKVGDLQYLISLSKGKRGITPMRDLKGFSTLLQQAKMAFASTSDVTFNRLVIITDDSMLDMQPSQLLESQRLSHSLVEMGVLVVPVFLNTSQFDPAPFWSKLVYMPSSMSTAARNSDLKVSMEAVSVDKLKTGLISLVHQKAERKPVEFRGRLLCLNMVIGICGYRIVAPRGVKPPQLLAPTIFGDGYEPVHREYKESDTDAETDEPKKAFHIRSTNENIAVSPQDLAALKNCNGGRKGHFLTVHCFIPFENCIGTNYMRLYKSTFIVPSNFQVDNSKAAFAALHRSMRRKDIVAVATYTSDRLPMLGLLYALDPGTPMYGPSTSCGMYFVKLPFADDMRDFGMVTEDEEAAESKNERDKKLVKLVAKLTRRFYFKPGFDPSLFPNPQTAQFAKVLNFQALGSHYRRETSLIKPEFDPIKPNYSKIDRNAYHLCSRINRALDKYTDTNKRRHHSLLDFEHAANIGTLSTFTVAELKWGLQELRLDTQGLKRELIKRLEEYYSVGVVSK